MASETRPTGEDSASELSVAPPEIVDNPSSRVFTVIQKPFRRFYSINSISEEPLFYVDVSSFTRHKPDLTLHAGPTSDAPVAAVCHFPKFSGDLKAGVGDPAAAGDAVRWEEVTRATRVRPSKFRWVTDFARPSSTAGTSPRALMWKRTAHIGVEGEKVMSWSARNHKLVDEATGELLAVFTSSLSFSRCGKLQINVDYGKDFDALVFITCVGLYEKARRRSERSSSGGGG